MAQPALEPASQRPMAAPGPNPQFAAARKVSALEGRPDGRPMRPEQPFLSHLDIGCTAVSQCTQSVGTSESFSRQK